MTAEGGSGAFQYSDDGVNFADGNVFDDLNAGSYTFFVQDEFGCSGSVTPTCLSLQPLKSLALCPRGSHR